MQQTDPVDAGSGAKLSDHPGPAELRLVFLRARHHQREWEAQALSHLGAFAHAILMPNLATHPTGSGPMGP